MSSHPVSRDTHLVVNKKDFSICVIARKDTLFKAPICVGVNLGNKTKKGDNKTPEGTFTISQIQNSSKWKHDFKDGFGERAGAYGPWFIRLKVPNWTGIGIHGTCFPHTIGTRASEGCVRLKNEDLIELKKYIRIGMEVIILPDSI